MDSSSKSRKGKQTAGRTEEEAQAARERGRKASEREGNRAGRKESTARHTKQQGDGRQGNCSPYETKKRYWGSPAPQRITSETNCGPNHHNWLNPCSPVARAEKEREGQNTSGDGRGAENSAERNRKSNDRLNSRRVEAPSARPGRQSAAAARARSGPRRVRLTGSSGRVRAGRPPLCRRRKANSRSTCRGRGGRREEKK